MIRTITAIAALAATPALADPGHIAHAGGHSHWELVAGLAVIAIAGVPFALRAMRRK